MNSDPHTRITLTIVRVVGALTGALIVGAFGLLYLSRPVPEWTGIGIGTGIGGLLTYLAPRPGGNPPIVSPVSTTGAADPPEGPAKEP